MTGPRHDEGAFHKWLPERLDPHILFTGGPPRKGAERAPLQPQPTSGVDSHLRAPEENLYIRDKDLVVATEKGGENLQASAASGFGYSSFPEFFVQFGQAGRQDLLKPGPVIPDRSAVSVDPIHLCLGGPSRVVPYLDREPVDPDCELPGGGPNPGTPTPTSVPRTPCLRYPRGTTTEGFTTTVRD